ncbi:lanthionine synthetase C family protein [Micromonospora sonneratiae]|uniref:Lanthionine synthetase C family protein n=1 Tax=Micromonospora sonneratiae TaxID=1184706 RepID=A0ABW3Y9G6_9ACTN
MTGTHPPDWNQCLATGAPGIALLHIHAARAGTGSWSTAQRWAAAMTGHSIDAHADNSSLYLGAPAVAFVLHCAEQPAWAGTLDALDGHIATATQQRLARAHDRIDWQQLPTLGEFDLISGLTGIGAYLLHRRHDDLLREVLVYLVRLTQPLVVGGGTLPGWWSHHGPADRPSPQWPGGHCNLGMAHGIAGPLSLLSLAMRRGVTVSGQAASIDRICTWLDRWRCGSTPSIWWPEMISRSEWPTHTVRRETPPRPSWCYGTPGLARAQQLAGIALGDTRRQQHAERAFAACLTDPRQVDQLDNPTLCHGWAGLTVTASRIAEDSINDMGLADRVSYLREQTRAYAHHHKASGDGLLEGATGVDLALAATAATSPATPQWDTCLLLS